MNSYRGSNKTVVVSSVFFLLGLLLIHMINYQVDEQIYESTVLRTFLPATADHITAAIEDINAQYETAVSLLASSVPTERLFRDGEDQPEAIAAYVSRERSRLNVKNVGFVSVNGRRYYDSLGQTLDLDFGSSRDQWILRFLQSEEAYRYSLYDPHGDPSLYSFFHDHKVYDDEGQVVAIIGVGISFEVFFERLKQHVPSASIAFLSADGAFRFPVEQRGQYLEETYAVQTVLDQSGERGVPSLGDLRDLETFDGAIVRATRNGRSVVFFLRYVPATRRYLLIEMDVTPYYHEVNRRFVASMIGGVALSVLIVLGNFIIVRRANRRLSSAAYTDRLTGAFNRSYLESVLSTNSRTVLSMVAFDVDHFKQINDEGGHTAGDAVLQTVTRIARRHLRGDDIVVRWGGDEFVLLLSADGEDAQLVCERIRVSIERETSVTITAGVTEFSPGEGLDDVFSRADTALYQAKRAGRNRVYTQ